MWATKIEFLDAIASVSCPEVVKERRCSAYRAQVEHDGRRASAPSGRVVWTQSAGVVAPERTSRWRHCGLVAIMSPGQKTYPQGVEPVGRRSGARRS